MTFQHQTNLLQFEKSNPSILKIDLQSVKLLFGPIPYTILQLLCDDPEGLSVKEIKTNLKSTLDRSLTDQTVYYHLRKLKDMKFIDFETEQVVDKNERLINIQKYFPIANKFIIDFSHASTEVIVKHKRPKFLEYFNNKSKFDGTMVIGIRSNDSPYVGPISFILGKYFNFSKNFVLFDNDILLTKKFGDNLILLGGPFVNNLYLLDDNKISDELPVKFLQSKDSGLLIQGKNQAILAKDKNLGVIQIIKNPWNKAKIILIIGGAKKIGTEAAVFSLTKINYISLIDQLLTTHKYCLIEPVYDSNNKIKDVRLTA